MVVLRLDVTQEDIDRGIPHDGFRCAVAHALRRLAIDQLNITGKWIGSLRPDRIPAEMCQFVADFDAGLPVQPCSFELTPEMFTVWGCPW